LPVESCCVITNAGSRSAWTGVSKWKAIITGRRWTTWILWEEGAMPSDGHRLLFAICGEKTPACSTVFNWVQSFSSGKETAPPAVDGWYRNNSEAIRKLPRRWQRCIDARGYCVELEIVNVQPRHNKIAANKVSRKDFRTPRVLKRLNYCVIFIIGVIPQFKNEGTGLIGQTGGRRV